MGAHGMSEAGGLREAVEALAKIVRPWAMCDDGSRFDHGSERAARAVLASDWLAAREAKARAEGAQVGLRAALDPGSFVPRGAAELAGEPFTERMDQWQRRAIDEGLARIAREVTRG